MKQHFSILAVFILLLSPATLIAEERAIEEIVVTATKREASIQDVPIAVSAFTGEDLDARGVQDLYGLQEVSPSISVYSSNSTSNGGTIRIRGVGTTGNNPGLEAAVGTFIDGIYRSRAGQAFSDLVDVERVEILRGPQGSLFGKNTSAGALQIITKKPEFERDTMIALSAGDFDSVRVQASTTGPIIDDRLAYRLAVNYHERDGYYEDDVTSDAYDGRDRYSVKGQLYWQGESWDNRFIIDFAEKDEDCCPANFQLSNFTENGPSATTRGQLSLGRPAGTVLNELLAELGRPLENAVPGDESFKVGTNFEPFEETEDWGVQNEFNIDINENMQLKSITAYREFEVDRGQDIDFSGADLLRPQFTHEEFENFSQEFQLTFSTDNADFLVGAYFYTEDINTDEEIRLASQGPRYLSQYIVGAALGDALATGAGAPFGTTVGATSIGTYDLASGSYIFDGSDRPNYQEGDGYFALYEQETQGWSVFTHNVFSLTERLDLSIGLRYSNEEKEAVSMINGVDPQGRSERELLIAMLNDEFNEDHCTGLVFIGAFCNLVSWEDEETEKEWSGTVQLSYAVNDDMNIYASYSRGYKAGGFNLDQAAIEMDSFATYLATGGQALFLSPTGLAADIPQEVLDATPNGDGRNGLTQFACGQGTGVTNPGPAELDCAFFDDDHQFDPEFVDAYEIGLKGTFLDGTLTTNIAIFYSDFEDFQLNTFTGTGFLISNTDEMITRGIEFESMWNLSDGIYWTLGITYADAKYGDDLNAETTELQLFLDQDFATLEDWGSLENIEGRQITHAPYWQGSTSLFMERQVGELMAYGNVNAGFRGAHNTGSDLKNEKDVQDELLINLQLGIRALDDAWDFQIWARNLTDNHVKTLVFNSVLQGESFSTFLAPPKMMGATLRFNL